MKPHHDWNRPPPINDPKRWRFWDWLIVGCLAAAIALCLFAAFVWPA